MVSVSSSTFVRGAVLSIAAILIFFPLTMLLFSGNTSYYLNIIFYSQRIFLIASIFFFLFFIFFKEKIRVLGWRPPDVDDAVVYTAMAFSLVFLLGFLHVNFDTLLRMDVIDVGEDRITVGFGDFLADSFDLAKIDIDQIGIKKIIDLENETIGPQVLKMNGGWEGEDGFASRVFLSVNNNSEIDISPSYAALSRSQPSWIEVRFPPGTFKTGRNIVLVRAEGHSRVFLSSQWVYHEVKTLGSDNTYYGQEALVYLKVPPVLPPLFREAFHFQFVIKLFAFFLLFLALFGMSTLKLAWQRFRSQLLVIGGASIFAVASLALIQNMWVYISPITASMLPAPLGLISSVYTDFQDPTAPTIGVNDFYVRIGKSCSGIESIGIFILLFPLIVALNWTKRTKRFIPLFFVVGIIGAFLVNVLRLIVFIIIGAFVSSDLAMDVFHSNLGWILMLGYFALFNEALIRICRRKSDENRN